MAITKIITAPNPILRQKSKEIPLHPHLDGKIFAWDKKVLSLIKDLSDTVKAQVSPKGAGLAAVQIGKPQRVFVLLRNKKIIPFINPQIVKQSQETLLDKIPENKQIMEGCLSVPGYWGLVNRPYKIKVGYFDLQGKKQTAELIGKQSSFFLHEYDHLEGILFIDRILEQKGKIYQLEKDKEGKETLIEVEI